MRKISIRQFQQNFHKELRDLPMTVTRFGRPSFLVDVLPNGMGAKEIKFAPKVEEAFRLLGKCAWTKVIGGNRFYCHNQGIKLNGDREPVCGEHLDWVNEKESKE